MFYRAFSFGIILVVTLVSGIRASCERVIQCPCGSKENTDNYTQCINNTSNAKHACARWANCETCEVNTTYCLKCPEDRYGPTCAEEKAKKESCPDPGIPEKGSRQKFNGTEFIEEKGSRRFIEGETIYFFCTDENYVLNGNWIIVCTSFGTWSDSLPSCEKSGEVKGKEETCPYPGIPEGGSIQKFDGTEFTEENGVFLEGESVYFFCDDEDSVLNGARVINCTPFGTWSDSIPRCENAGEAQCADPGSLQNGGITVFFNPNVRNPSALGNYPVGTRLKYDCSSRYRLEGERDLFCMSNGTWSGDKPRCIEATMRYVTNVICPIPTIDPNGDMEYISPNDPRRRDRGFEIGSEVKFLCKKGFEINGTNPITCLRNGQWTSDPPKCENKSHNLVLCTDPGSIKNGGVTVYYNSPYSVKRENPNEYPIATRFLYDCNIGYRLEGESNLICRATGRWSCEKPKCVEESKQPMLAKETASRK